MQHITFRVIRLTDDPHTITLALVTAELTAAAVEQGLNKEAEFLKALTAGVSQWVKDVEEGRAAWKNSSKDFNIGDLSHYVGDLWLQRILRDIGIYGLEIDIVHSDDLCSNWLYDTVLVDEDVLARED